MEVKRKNKHIGIIILIGFLLIIGGIIIYAVINYSNDQAEIKKRMNVVVNTYDEFKSNVDNFNKIRDNIYKEVMQDMYYQTLKENDEHYKELFANYKESLEAIDKNFSKLKNKCINVLYPEVSVNNKCEAVVIGYEEVVNTYVSDVKGYNNNIKAYNKWLDENQSNDTKLEEIKLDRDYLDINGDREYKGKQEESVQLNDASEVEENAEPDE